MATLNKPEDVPADLRKEIEEMFGMLPTFARTVPPDAMRIWWSALKDFQMSDKTALDGKVKELIGLGVSSQIPCHYCVLFHTEAARLNGATDQEIQEAVFMASVTRMGSTILNGNPIEHEVFDKELKQMLDYIKAQATAQAQQAAASH